MKLLMHTCCAPCSVYCIDELRKNGIEPTLYWYNPNIHPYTEYVKRKDCLKEYSKKINVKAIFEDEYGLDNRLALDRAMKNLKKRELNILKDRFIVGKTQMEIAEELGISQAQISRIEKNAINTIKKNIK